MTPEQLTPIVKARLKAALMRRAPQNNITTWQEREADALGVAHTTFRNWYYGDGLPGMAGWIALQCRYDGIAAEVLDGVLPTPAERADSRMETLISEIRNVCDAAESGLVTQPVPLRKAGS